MSISKRTRLIVAAVYFIAVNALCGLLAAEFGYPSLWANTTVFPEYAYPHPFGWALVHWISLAPLTKIAFSMWEWDAAQIRRLRFTLVGIIVLCVCAEFAYGGGRWHRVPFLLFPLVDSSVSFLLTLVMTRRGLLTTGAVASVGGIILFSVPTLVTAVHEHIDPHGFRDIVAHEGWVRPVEVLREGDRTVYIVALLPSSHDAHEKSMCLEVLSVYEQMLERHDPFDRTEPVVRLTRDSRPDEPIGQARYSTRGHWYCTFDEA